MNPGVCGVCGAKFDRRRYSGNGREIVGVTRSKSCPRHRWTRGKTPLIDRTTPYREDVACQLFVRVFRGGATLDAIADAMDVSRERVRQIEVVALSKLKAGGVHAFGIDPEDPEELRDGQPRRHDSVRGAVDDDPEEEAVEF